MPSTFDKFLTGDRFSPPQNWVQIKTIDMHTGGEPLRVIMKGVPVLKGQTVLDYRKDLSNNHDYLRKSLMHEPRGHADMYGCVLVPPNDEEADFGILFMHNEGYSTMCGHAIIAITKLAVIMKWVKIVEPQTRVVIDAPCGRIYSFAKIENEKVTSVYFHGVPSFVLLENQVIDVASIGQVKYDIAYGGAFYAYVNSDDLNLQLVPENYSEIIQKGKAIKNAIIAAGVKIDHPFEKDLSFLYGTIFIGSPVSQGADSRNVCVFADGEVDRCPTGSGVSGRMPLHYFRGELKMEQEMRIESLIKTRFKGKVVGETQYGPYKAVIPSVEGNAFITGEHTFFINPDDPLKNGFFLR